MDTEPMHKPREPTICVLSHDNLFRFAESVDSNTTSQRCSSRNISFLYPLRPVSASNKHDSPRHVPTFLDMLTLMTCLQHCSHYVPQPTNVTENVHNANEPCF